MYKSAGLIAASLWLGELGLVTYSPLLLLLFIVFVNILVVAGEFPSKSIGTVFPQIKAWASTSFRTSQAQWWDFNCVGVGRQIYCKLTSIAGKVEKL